MLCRNVWDKLESNNMVSLTLILTQEDLLGLLPAPGTDELSFLLLLWPQTPRMFHFPSSATCPESANYPYQPKRILHLYSNPLSALFQLLQVDRWCRTGYAGSNLRKDFAGTACECSCIATCSLSLQKGYFFLVNNSQLANWSKQNRRSNYKDCT